MDSSFALYLGRHTLETALLLAAPILVVCLVVGIVVTLFQAVTSIRDTTLTIIPKLLALGARLPRVQQLDAPGDTAVHPGSLRLRAEPGGELRRS